jgi:hypothetical protein
MNFLIDLWQDLREKRLWPVAVGLLAATAAIPLLLFKPVSDASTAPPSSGDTGPREVLPVVSVESGPNRGSNLTSFGEKNPFKPMKDLAKESAANTADDSASGDGATTGSAGADTGSGSDTGSSSGSGGSGGSGDVPAGFDPSGPRVQWFRYASDFEFGEPGKEKKFEKAASFTLLPSETAPAVVYMGVTDDAKHAQFFIADQGFVAEGEGHCNKGTACRFVTLSLASTGDEMTFTSSDGQVTYNVRLLKIKRENLTSGGTTDTSGDKAGKAIASALTAPAEAAEAGSDPLSLIDAPSGAVARVNK